MGFFFWVTFSTGHQKNSQSEMGDTDATSVNVTNLARDLLFVVMWVGAWGTLDLAIQWLSANQKIQLVIYLCLFVAGFVALIFVEVPVPAGQSGTTEPDIGRNLSAPLRSLQV